VRAQFAIALFACFALAGCHANEQAVTRDALVGSYSYISHDPDGKSTDHAWDHLALKADGKYDLVEGGPTKARSEKVGLWSFIDRGDAVLLLDHAGYPVRVKGGEIRLMIDDDTGIWFAKAK
jgi:hypothetical protein